MHQLRKFLSYYRPYRGWLLADMACALVLAGVTLLLPLCTHKLTNDLLEGHRTQIYLMGIAMLGLVALHFVCNLFVDYQGHVMGAKIESDMRNELFDHYQKLSFRFYDEQKTGQLMTRLTNDLFWLSELYHHGAEDLVISLLKFIGTFAILVSINAELAGVVFLFLPVMAFYGLYFNKHMNRALRESKERIGDINAQVEDSLAGIRVVKSFTNEAIEREKFTRENRRFVESRGRGYRSEAYFSGGMIAFTQVMTVAVIIFGAVAIKDDVLSLADLVTFLLCIEILIDPIQRLVNFTRLYQEGYTGFVRFMEMLDIAPDIQDSPDAVQLDRVQGHLEFRDVHFKYRDDHKYVLKNISLKIEVGAYIAIVGSSGVGKTTLCSLIPRFYDVNEGAILLDGHDIRAIRQDSLRKHIGIVQQDVYLFAGTVAENIRYGCPDASREDIIQAAKQANAHEFILSLPDGYDTDIGQRGVKLSGGQKQRLSIARVFLKNPPILIFDEATSALDNESEKAVRESLEKLAHNRTTLVIAHRLSTIRNARRILVLTEHGIAEQGTHETLIDLNGTYANLYTMQAKI